MAREFSAREARQLIREHERLLRSLEGIAGLPAALGAEAGRAMRELARRGIPGELIARALASPGSVSLRTPETDRLLAALYRCRKSRYTAAAAEQLLGRYAKRVRQESEILRAGAGGLRRLFAGSGEKAAAEAAYRELSSLLSGTYASAIRGMEEEAAKGSGISPEAAWREAEAAPEAYAALAEELVPGYARLGTVRPFAALLERLNTLEGRIAACDPEGTKDRERIKEAALALTAGQAMDILKEVPVEELNRGRGGIRTKTLRDNGFATVADVHNASLLRLAAVNGISEDGAYLVKQAARDFAREAGNRGRIRLSADDRSPEASRLVQALLTCREGDKLRAPLRDLLEKNEAALRRDREALETAGGGLPWLFLPRAEREAVLRAYGELEALLGGDFGRELEKRLAPLERRPAVTEADAWADFTRNSIADYTLLEEVLPGCLGGDSRYGLPEELAEAVAREQFFPEGLLCTLRRYQEWGVKYILHQERVLLGDEMGLGKTVQAIAAMVSQRNTGAERFLVVCPASVAENWCREIVRHSRLEAVKIHGPGRNAALQTWLETGGAAVTTYETARDMTLPEDCRFSLLVADEAHYIKNPEARRTVGVKRLCAHAERLLFMTGTALENRVDEMIALISILQPQVAERVRSMAFMAAAPRFREEAAPVYYRRKREDVLTELPELIESREWCVLTREEEGVYESTLLSGNYAAVRRVSWNVGDLDRSCKAARLLELIREAEEDGRKILVFSFFLDTLRDLAALLGDRCGGVINGSVPPLRRQEIIDRFDSAPAGTVLLAQIQSGGTGLNIQSASVVVICEPQFKPSVENQAVSRAYRMGQGRNVLVYRLLCENTVDEHILEILERKQAEFDAFADESAAAERSRELDEAGFGEIIREELERISRKNRNNGEEQICGS